MKFFLACVAIAFSMCGSALAQSHPAVEAAFNAFPAGTGATIVRTAALKDSEEAAQLNRQRAKFAAQKWLKWLRQGTEAYDLVIRYVYEEAYNGSLTLADIGTSEEEMKKLYALGAKTAARKWYGYLCKGAGERDPHFMAFFIVEMVRGNLRLPDMGTCADALSGK